MDVQPTDVDRGRIARVVAAVALVLVAIQAFRKGKRVRGLVASAGAVALGYTLTDGFGDGGQMIDLPSTDVGTDDDADQLRCGICGEPIVPGQRRVPTTHAGTVHESCAE